MSELKQIPFDQATDDELRHFANTSLGLNVHHNTGRAKVEAAIKAAWDKDHVLVDRPDEGDLTGDAPAVSDETKVIEPLPVGKQASGASPVASTAKKAKGTVTLVIASSSEDGNDHPIPLGVNGRIMLVPRGEQVTIPRKYFTALKNAAIKVYQKDKNGSLIYPPRSVPSYPYQIISEQ